MTEKKAVPKTLFIGFPHTKPSYATGFVHSVYLGCLSFPQVMLILKKYNIQILPIVEQSFPIDANRNKIIDNARNGIQTRDNYGQAMKIKADYLMMLDTDQTFPLNTLDKLLYELLTNNLDIISGMYYQKKGSYAPVMGRFVEPTKNLYRPIYYWPDDRLWTVDIVGMGCILMDMRIFEKIKPPYYEYGFNIGNNMFGEYKDISEDIIFCKKLAEAGIKIWVDPAIQCGHITETEITKDVFIQIRDHIEKNAKGTDKEYYWNNIYDIRKDDKTEWII